MMSEMIWLNGALCSSQAVIDGRDRGFTLGDGLFETMLWTGSSLRLFERHMARLLDGCVGLRLPVPPDAGAVLTAIDQVLEANGISQSVASVRLTWSRGVGARGLTLPGPQPAATLMITASAFMPDTSPVALHLVDISRPAGNPSARYKTLSYVDQVMALAQAQALGGTDAVVTGRDGRVACASAASLVLITADGRALTPPVADGALPGTVRGYLTEQGLLEEAPITIADVEAGTAMATTNALQGVRPVASFGRQGLSGLTTTSFQPDHPELGHMREALASLGALRLG
jgi:branched-chain amino acid aminotransferase